MCLIQMLRRESNGGHTHDLAHVQSDGFSLTKHSANADELIKPVLTSNLLNVDAHPQFRTMLQNTAFGTQVCVLGREGMSVSCCPNSLHETISAILFSISADHWAWPCMNLKKLVSAPAVTPEDERFRRMLRRVPKRRSSPNQQEQLTELQEGRFFLPARQMIADLSHLDVYQVDANFATFLNKSVVLMTACAS